VISPSQIPLPDITQYPKQTDIHAARGIRTRSPRKRSAADPRLRPRGHFILFPYKQCIITWWNAAAVWPDLQHSQ
jgi:hypothetical protein